MASFLDDNEDLRYYLRDGLDWQAVFAATEFGSAREGGFRSAEEALTFYREVATTAGGFVATNVAPHSAEIDRQGIGFEGGEAVAPPRLAEIFRKIADLGLHGLNLPRELGG